MKTINTALVSGLLWVARTVPFMLLVWAIVALIGAWWSVAVALVSGAAFAWLEGFLGMAGGDYSGRRKR
jgi:hypothetical protein